VELEILTGDLVRVAHETVQPARYSLWLRYSASDKKPRADRLSAPLAWFVCALSVASALSGLVFLYMNGNFASVLKDEGVDAVAAVAFPIVGAIIAARRPRNPIGWIFCFTGLSLGIAIFAAEYAVYALVTEPGALPVGVLAAWLGTWTWVPGIVLGPTFSCPCSSRTGSYPRAAGSRWPGSPPARRRWGWGPHGLAVGPFEHGRARGEPARGRGRADSRGRGVRRLDRRGDGARRPTWTGWATSWSRWCGGRCSLRTSRCGCARRMRSEKGRDEARSEKFSGRGVFIAFRRRSVPRMVLKEVR
jgi:hypothetical protein